MKRTLFATLTLLLLTAPALAQNPQPVRAEMYAYDGSAYQRLTFGTAGSPSSQILTVQGASSMTPLIGNLTQLLSAAISATNPMPVRITNGTAYTTDDVADGETSTNNPVPVGALVETSPAGITLLDDGDRMYVSGDADRATYVRMYGGLADQTQARATNTDGASTAFSGGLAAAGSGVRHYLLGCTVVNSSATPVSLDLRDGAAGSVLWTLYVPATSQTAQPFPGHGLKFSTNTAVAYDASAGVSTLTVSCTGYKSKGG